MAREVVWPSGVWGERQKEEVLTLESPTCGVGILGSGC